MTELYLGVCTTLVDAALAALPGEATAFVKIAPLPCADGTTVARDEAIAALRASRADVTVDVIEVPSTDGPAPAAGCPHCGAWFARPEQLQWRVMHRISRWSLAQVAAARAQSARQLARYAMAFEVLGRLPVLEGVKQIIEVITDLLTALFAPGVITFTHVPALATALAPVLDETAADSIAWTSPMPWEETATGFRLRIEHNSTLFGVFDLGAFQEPAARDRYINLAVTLASVIGMALANARALHGIITMCSHCKKIRDDAGVWQSVEAYMIRHSDARFSHGICPTCVERFERGED